MTISNDMEVPPDDVLMEFWENKNEIFTDSFDPVTVL